MRLFINPSGQILWHRKHRSICFYAMVKSATRFPFVKFITRSSDGEWLSWLDTEISPCFFIPSIAFLFFYGFNLNYFMPLIGSVIVLCI